MIKDFNEVGAGEVFHFKNSLKPFIYLEFWNIKKHKIKILFLDIHTNNAYRKQDLNILGYEFYTKEDNKDFQGVEVDGEIEWVDV